MTLLTVLALAVCLAFLISAPAFLAASPGRTNSLPDLVAWPTVSATLCCIFFGVAIVRHVRMRCECIDKDQELNAGCWIAIDSCLGLPHECFKRTSEPKLDSLKRMDGPTRGMLSDAVPAADWYIDIYDEALPRSSDIVWSDRLRRSSLHLSPLNFTHPFTERKIVAFVHPKIQVPLARKPCSAYPIYELRLSALLPAITFICLEQHSRNPSPEHLRDCNVHSGQGKLGVH